MKNQQVSIGREKAIALHDAEWWKEATPVEIAKFQLVVAELCIPFDMFQLALNDALGRPVFTHELALNYDGIFNELFKGAPAPTLEEIINLIPADKRIIVTK